MRRERSREGGIKREMDRVRYKVVIERYRIRGGGEICDKMRDMKGDIIRHGRWKRDR